MARHMTIEQLPYGKPVQSWLKDRYGETEANHIWEQTQQNYKNYLTDLPDYGGSKNGHARAIYGGLGKTTIANLLPRFWDIQSGSICLRGKDIRTV